MLAMFKPDALGFELVPEGLQLLKEGMDREKIEFRFAGIILLNATHQLSDLICSDNVKQPWYPVKYRPFLTGEYPKECIPQAPLIAMMLEIKRESGRDIFKTVSEIIGPTNIEKYAKENPWEDKVKNTIRYQLVVGKGMAGMPDTDGPVTNRIHRSANEQNASDELYPIFGVKGILNVIYERSAVNDVLSGWGQRGFADVPGVARIPLHEYLGADPGVLSVNVINALLNARGCRYRDFDESKAQRLMRSLNEMKGMIQESSSFET